jgi:hypothetical protein
VADKADGSSKIRRQSANEGPWHVIPSKCNAKRSIPHTSIPPTILSSRMEDMRSLATRFEKIAAPCRRPLTSRALWGLVAKGLGGTGVREAPSKKSS